MIKHLPVSKVIRHCYCVSVKTSRFVYQMLRPVYRKWRRLSRAKRASLILGATAFTFLLLPNIRGGLKILGFVEKDFLISTSGALYETNNKTFPYFRALIGSSADTTKTTLSFEVEQTVFSIGLTQALETTSVVSQTPTPSPSSDTVIPQELLHAEEELASISAQINELSYQVEEIDREVVRAIGESEQTFFGPFEKVILRTQSDSNALSYYKTHDKLVEEWQIYNNKLGGYEFLLEGEGVDLKILNDQTWEVYKGSQILLKISHELTDANGQKTSLPSISEQVIPTTNGKLLVTLQLPNEWMQENDKKYPLKLTREFIKPSARENDSAYVLQKVIGQKLFNEAVITAPTPTFLTSYKNEIIFWDADSGSIMFSKAGEILPLFTEPNITGLDCYEEDCVFATASQLVYFSPETLLDMPLSERSQTFEVAPLGDTPVGGISIGSSSLLRTSFVNPEGVVYLHTFIGDSGEKIKTQLNFPQMPVMSQDDKYYAFWGDGKLWYWQGSEFSEVLLPDKPVDLALGNDNRLYFIMYFGKINSFIIARVTPGLGLEIAKGLSGEFTSIEVDDEQLLFGVRLSDKEGAVVRTNTENIDWVLWNQYE